jgi:hypothetical protein
MDKMREEFEYWFSQFENKSAIQRLDAWSAWQESRAVLCVELPENCKGMALTVSELRRQLGKAGVSLK